MSEPTRHISGRLKQTNKRHNKLGHASKRGVDRRLAAGGRVEKPPKPGRRHHKPGAEHQRSKFPIKDSGEVRAISLYCTKVSNRLTQFGLNLESISNPFTEIN